MKAMYMIVSAHWTKEAGALVPDKVTNVLTFKHLDPDCDHEVRQETIRGHSHYQFHQT